MPPVALFLHLTLHLGYVKVLVSRPHSVRYSIVASTVDMRGTKSTSRIFWATTAALSKILCDSTILSDALNWTMCHYPAQINVEIWLKMSKFKQCSLVDSALRSSWASWRVYYALIARQILMIWAGRYCRIHRVNESWPLGLGCIPPRSCLPSPWPYHRPGLRFASESIPEECPRSKDKWRELVGSRTYSSWHGTWSIATDICQCHQLPGTYDTFMHFLKTIWQVLWKMSLCAQILVTDVLNNVRLHTNYVKSR